MDISSQYRSFFGQPDLRVFARVWQFTLTIYRADKWRELISYVVWELMHRSGINPASRYLQFSDSRPLVLANTSALPATLVMGTSTGINQAGIPWSMLLSGFRRERWGCRFDNPSGLYFSPDGGQSALLSYQFLHPIQSLFYARAGHLYVCSHGKLFRTADRGASFQQVLSLSSTSSYFLFNNGMTELPDGRLVIGEYGVVVRQKSTWQNLAYIYFSTDQGLTWQVADFLIRDGVNKHVHLIKYSLHLNALLLTDGDNKKQIWINRSLTRLDRSADSSGNGWHRLNRFHNQTGGYLSMVSLNNTVLLGSDYLGGTNFVVSTTNGIQFTKQIIPDPYRRSPVMNMVMRRTKEGGVEVWAVLHNSIASTTRCLLMYSADTGQTWTKVIDYDGTQHEIKLVSSSSGVVDELYIAIITRRGSQFDQTVYAVTDL